MRSKYFLFALAAIVFSYAPIWARGYINLFKNSNTDLSINLVPETTNSADEVIYHTIIPPEKMGETLSLGVVWPIPKLTCDNNIITIAGTAIAIDKNSVTSFRLPNETSCEKLTIGFKKTPGYYLVGPISGHPFLSNPKTAESYKRIVDFFFRDIRLLLLIVAAMYVLMIQLAKRNPTALQYSQSIERYGVPWGLFLLSSAGIFEIFLPWESVQSFIPRINSYLSAVAHLGPGIDYMFRRFKKEPPKLSSMLLLFTFVLIAPDRMLAFISVGLPIGFLALASTIGAQYVGPYRYYSLLLIINFIKLAGGFGIDPTYLPHIHLVSIYIGFVMGDNLVNLIGSFSKLSSFITWTNKTRSQTRTEEQIHETLTESLTATQARKASLVVSDNGNCELYTAELDSLDRINKYKRNIDQLPYISAAVITSGNPVWLLDERSERAANLRKGKPPLNQGSFSVLPLKLKGTAIAALSLSGLEKSDEEHDLEAHRGICEIIGKHLETLIEEISNSTLAKGNQDLVAATKYFSELSGPEDGITSVSNSVNDFLKKIRCQSVFFKYDNLKSLYSPLFTAHLSADLVTLAKDLNIKILDTNEHGPFVLSVRNQRPVFVNDLSIIEDVLSKRTSAYFRECGSKSIAIIPLYDEGGLESKKNVAYVLMVQSSEIGRFTSEIQNVLCRYTNIIEQYLSKLEFEALRDRQMKIIGEFVPPEIRGKIISGEKTRIDSIGFLGCLDIIGSSLLLKKYGDEWLRGVVNEIVNSVSGIKTNAKLVSMNWDALYFQTSNPEELLNLFKKIENLSFSFPEHKIIDKPKISFRFCVTHGDTSQDFCESNGFKRWTVVGEAMANVCKFEQSVKSLGSGVFFDAKAFAVAQSKIIATLVHSADDKEIFRIDSAERKVA